MPCALCRAYAADAATYRRALKFILENKITTAQIEDRFWLKRHTGIGELRVPDDLLPIITGILWELELGAVSAG